MNIFSRRYVPWIALAVLFAPSIQLCKGQQKAPPAPTPTPELGQGPFLIAPPPRPRPLPTPRKARPKDWRVAEEFDFDWQGNGSPAHFKIEQSQEEQISRVTITMKTGPGLVLENDDVWEEFARDFVPEEDFLKKNKNLAPSKYVFSLAPSPGAKPLIFLVTPQYGSDPGNLFVLAMDPQGNPKLSLTTTLHIKEFRDLDGDGVAEIVGEPCFSQGWGHDFLTYDPFRVYQFQAAPQPTLELSLPLTREYNLKHYYGWAGVNCSEDLAVVLHPPGGGKPVIVKSAEAKMMFGKKK